MRFSRSRFVRTTGALSLGAALATTPLATISALGIDEPANASGYKGSSGFSLFLKCMCGLLLCIVTCFFGANSSALAAEATYQIYPTPHSVEYLSGVQTLREDADLVVEKGIDADTRVRLEEALALKNINGSYVDEIVPQKATTTILVGIYGSGDVVDKHVSELKDAGTIEFDESLFDKTDAYLLLSIPAASTTGEQGTSSGDEIIVLGRDSDASFYGLTTLYQIFQQIPGSKIKALSIQDYADVITRGFIEGYYGNPWSVQDRINLMTWGGYYKLNAYVYAPKDDPKHNQNWRELYTEAELKNQIEPLAKAGNESKCRFIYALHPFMNNPITSANYDDSVAALKKKFQQVMDHGVRQIAILADDQWTITDGGFFTRLLKDMSDWIHTQQQTTTSDGTLKYPGLKDTIIFCPVNYTSFGESWYQNLPSNIQVVNTGGQVWGKINHSFATRFKSNSGNRAPFMWINWPCSDNDATALHMGGHNNFLGADLKPGDVEGVVVNPMQQSEPSKQGIFMNADFTWNLWQSVDHADQVWENSFSYIDHNSPLSTKGSDALKELSSHMLRMYGGGVTWINNESADIKDALQEFTQKLAAGSIAEADVDHMISIFSELADAAQSYRNYAGNQDMLTQMICWIDTWDDLTEAALAHLEALKADLSGNTSQLLALYAKGSKALDSADSHGYPSTIGRQTEYARVGKAYIYPFVCDLDEYVSQRAELTANPNALVKRFITNRSDTPTASTDSVFDSRFDTGLSYKNPATITKDTYIGYQQSKPFDLSRFTVTYDQNHLNDTIRTGKLQALRMVGDSKKWVDIAGQEIQDNKDRIVDFKDLNESGIYGVRLIATADNSGACWLTVNEIEINKDDSSPSVPSEPVQTPTITTNLPQYQNNAISLAIDSDPATGFWSSRNTQKNDWVMLNFNGSKRIDTLSFMQSASDSWTAADVFYTTEAQPNATAGSWKHLTSLGAGQNQTLSFKAIDATAVKVVSTTNINRWFQLFEIDAYEKHAYSKDNIYSNFDLSDSDVSARVGEGEAELSSSSVHFAKQGEVVAIDLGNIRRNIEVRALTQDIKDAAALVYSQNGLEWHDVEGAAVERARYVGYKALKDNVDIDLTGFGLNYLASLEPALVKSDVSGYDGFNAEKVFDRKIETNSTIAGTPHAGDTIVFDLGQTRHINTFDYFLPETSKDFIRNAVIEIAHDPDAPDAEWETVLDVNSKEIVEDTFNDDVAKSAAWLTHSSEHPGNMFKRAEGLDVSGRYLRIRFTGTYSHRWVCLGELLINDGEHVSTYVGGDFESSSQEKEGMSEDALTDSNLATSWRPFASDAGTLTYHVSEPLYAADEPYQGIRIISGGSPSNALVKAVVYTDKSFNKTKTIELGALDQLAAEFSFIQDGQALVVKDVVIEWQENAVPEIAEMYLLKSVNVPDQDLTDQLNELIGRAEAQNTSTWTKKCADELARAVANAKAVLQNSSALTDQAIEQYIRAIDNALLNPVLRYSGSELADMVKEPAVSDDGYTASTWQRYEQALKAAQNALQDEDNLSVAEGEKLLSALQDAYSALKFDESAKDRAIQALEDTEVLFGAGDYTKSSHETLDAARKTLQALVDNTEAKPKELIDATHKLQETWGALVDISALRAKQEEFKAHTPSAYTDDSFARYKAAYDASLLLLESATSGEVEAAINELEGAKVALVPVSLDDLIAGAAKLNEDDYTEHSWKLFQEALSKAKKSHDSSQEAQLLEELHQAQAQLVNVAALKEAYQGAAHIDKDRYTASSIHELELAMQAAVQLMKDGTNKTVESGRQALIAALHALKQKDSSAQEGQHGNGSSSPDLKTHAQSSSKQDKSKQSNLGLAQTGDLGGILNGCTAALGGLFLCSAALVRIQKKK